MNPNKYAELLNYIQENNGWKNSYERENITEVPFIKYVTCHYDTRDGRVYKVVIRDGEKGYKIFNTETEEDYHNLMNYLNGKESTWEVEQ